MLVTVCPCFILISFFSGTISVNKFVILAEHPECCWQVDNISSSDADWIMHHVPHPCALCAAASQCPNHGVKLSRGAADLPVSVLLRMEACCSTSTVREAMALTVSASSSDWPWAPVGPSNSEWPLVWDKLWRQGQCLPSGTEREIHMGWGSIHVGASLHHWGYALCVCVCFLLWISITLSSEAQAFGHGFSWGHWNTESHWQRQRGCVTRAAWNQLQYLG